MRALVTGADGFVGQWLLRALLDAGDNVAGTTHHPEPLLTTLKAETARSLTWHRIDLQDIESLRRALGAAKPEAVYHLAAQSSGAASFSSPLETHEINVMGTARLLEACRDAASDAIVLCVGSSEVYGSVEPANVPLTERTPLQPGSPYAASKAAAEMLALQYARAGWLRVVATRSFNHTGPGQDAAFVVPGFATQIVERKRRGGPIEVGNLSARRDFTDVRDVVSAYRLLVTCGTSGNVYNVCSGQAVSMREILKQLAAIAGLENFEAKEDPQRLRPVDAPLVIGDPTAIRSATGWQPKIPWDKTLRDTYAWCAARA